MTRLPFIVTHDGQSARCNLVVDARQQVKLIEVVVTPPQMALAPDAMEQCGAFYDELCKKIEMLNDFMAAEMPFEALATCRRSPGLFGAILDPAATEVENLRTALKGDGHAA